MNWMRRDYYIGHPDDDRDKFEETMNDILYEDDANELHEYLKVFGDDYHYPAFLDMCLRKGATNCVLHIIQGKLPHGPPILAADHVEPKPELPVLYRVIHRLCKPRVFHLLLTDCGAVTQVNQTLQGLLPLHWLLDLLPKRRPLSKWSPGQPLSTVIDSLFLPKFRRKLECAQMLAQHTHSLDQVALGFIQNEEIISLAALLLVVPFTSDDFETIKPYTSIKSIASQAINGQSVSTATFCAIALLYIFEKGGDKLITEFNNLQKGVVQPAEGDESIVNRLIQQIGNTSSVRSLVSKSSQVIDRTRENDMMCRDGAGQIRTFCTNNDDAMEHFKSSDARQVNLTYTRLLHSVLGSLVKYEYLSKWSPGQSLVKLILLLFLQPELKPTLECAQLVAKRTNSVNEVALNLIRQGELIQLAALLLVARKKAMEPFDSGDTIKEATSMENIVSQVFRGESVTATVGAAGLFQIFDKAGDALAEYLSIHNDEHHPVQVIFEVAKRILHYRIKVLSTDVDLTDIYGSHPETLKSICGWLGIKIDDTSKLSQINGKSPFPSIKSVKQRCRRKVSSMNFMLDMTKSETVEPSPTKNISQALNKLGTRAYSTSSRVVDRVDMIKSVETSLRVPTKYISQDFDKLGSRAFSSSSRVVDRVGRGTLKHSPASPSPLVRDLAYLAMKLKRGVRLV